MLQGKFHVIAIDFKMYFNSHNYTTAKTYEAISSLYLCSQV